MVSNQESAKMTPPEVVAFKSIFNDAHELRRRSLVNELCAFIAVKLVI